jgi:hypothetical protein
MMRVAKTALNFQPGGTRLENTQDYYAARSRHEREMAAAARDPAVARIHQTLAEHYEALAAKTQPDRAASAEA